MYWLAAFLVASVNALLVYLISFLAVSGADGGTSGVEKIRLVGFAWVALMLTGAWVLCAFKRAQAGVLLAGATLPLGFAIAIAAETGWTAWSHVRPNRPEFELACRTAGATYLVAPSAPVGSIAFDWDPGQFRPYLNHFYMDTRGNLNGRAYIRPRFPSTIAFTESRRAERRSSKLSTPYVREIDGQRPVDAPELTADALVEYETTSSNASPSEDRLSHVNVRVSDRRSGQQLAKLDYFVDERRFRACGETSAGEMDETAFVLKAIGAQIK